MKYIILTLAMLFGALRFTLPVSGINQADTFKDLAHVFVGMTLGLAIASQNKLYWIIFVTLCVLEVTAVVIR
jgi:hypothetical protein